MQFRFNSWFKKQNSAPPPTNGIDKSAKQCETGGEKCLGLTTYDTVNILGC